MLPVPLVVATANPGKLREFVALLAGLPFELMSQAALGIAAPEETGASFLDNALLKARHAAAGARLLGRAAVIADDSGLEVDALGGAPGVYSARYAGPTADDAANTAKLLRELRDVPARRRGARYRCVLVFLPPQVDAAPLVASGCWEGRIAEEPRGAGGFGYDPCFFLPELGVTAAEIDAEHKNRISHRGHALRDLQRQLAARFAVTGTAPVP
jgi:XTP/dITP diphosphohydrolase